MEITLDNIKAFIQGNARLYKLVALESYQLEQVAYRAQICYQSCYVDADKYCEACGCSVPGKWYANKACKGNKYPDMMDEASWIQYKLDNELDINFGYLNMVLDGDI